MELEKRTDHLLACLTEECGEVSQLVGKCLRFGIYDKHPKTGNIENFKLLEQEVNEVIAVAKMLKIKTDLDWQERKKLRVEEYILYAEREKI